MPRTAPSLAAIDLLSIGNLHPSDVIAARNSAAHKHPGNIRYNALIREHGPVYQATKKRDDKSRLTRQIIQTVEEDYGGKFVKLVGDEWVEISNTDKHEKVSHALRSKAYAKRKMSHFPNSTQKKTKDVAVKVRSISPVSFNLMDHADILLGSQHDSKSDMDFLLDEFLPCLEVNEEMDSSFNDSVSTLSSEDNPPLDCSACCTCNCGRPLNGIVPFEGTQEPIQWDSDLAAELDILLEWAENS